jgi:hypothetical protein
LILIRFSVSPASIVAALQDRESGTEASRARVADGTLTVTASTDATQTLHARSVASSVMKLWVMKFSVFLQVNSLAEQENQSNKKIQCEMRIRCVYPNSITEKIEQEIFYGFRQAIRHALARK